MSDISILDFKHITETLLLYTSVVDDPIVAMARKMAELLAQDNKNNNQSDERWKLARQTYYKYAAALVAQAEKYGYTGNLFRRHLQRLFLADENPFTLACERQEIDEKSTLFELALRDVRAMRDMCTFDIGIFSRHVGQNENLTDYKPNCAAENPYVAEMDTADGVEEWLDALRLYYRMLGCGTLAEHGMLLAEDGGLAGVKSADTARLDDIVGYREQKLLLRDNTEAFLKGLPANNMLLIGARGTGKSTCVKALANEYFNEGLRVVELSKDKLGDLPTVLDMLAERGKKFIVYIDDLSFDDSESRYKHLKSILEGGVVRRPKNVLFCATSNRRHIVQEKWSDKLGGYEDEELHATDTRNEKMSLSDRFGLTITFQKPSPQEYFAIVAALAEKEGLGVSEDFLREQAAAWELSQKGLSGRTARQFLDHMICEINKG